MKNIVKQTIIYFSFSLVFSLNIVAQSKQEAEIMAAIKAETEAYYKADAKKYESVWAKDDKIGQTFIAKSSYSTNVGWGKIVPGMVKYLETAKPINMENKYENIHIKADKNLAFVEFDQTQTIPNNSVYKRFSHEFRVLVKEQGHWLLYNQITTDPETFKTTNNENEKLPASWFKSGQTPDNYLMKLEKGTGFENTNCASITSIDKAVEGFGTLMQTCLPDKFLGKRIKLTGYVKSKNLTASACIWMRIDTKAPSEAILFDNMNNGKKDRTIKGTTDWQKYEIVLDVPDNTTNIAYGAFLVNNGQIWIDKFNIEIVDSNTPTTGISMDTSSKKNISNNKEPLNMDFEK
jgi:hypothetical protein